MTTYGYSYDHDCEVLARKFLLDDPRPFTEKDLMDLAQFIQDAIENWFAGREKQ